MMESQTLTFAWTPWTVLIAVAAVLATVVVAWIACHRRKWSRHAILLESLRLTMVVMAAILLGGPEWVEQYRPNDRPVVAVLWDDSSSMSTRDVTEPNAEGNGTTSRSDSIEGMTDLAAWDALRERADVIIEPFSQTQEKSVNVSGQAVTTVSNAAGQETGAAASDLGLGKQDAETIGDQPGTDLSTPLTLAATKYENLLGVVMASDGDWNQGETPVVAAERLRAMGVPVFAFPVGSRSRLPDVELISFDVPTFAIAGKQLRIPLTLESSLPRDHVATVTMKTSRGETVSKQVQVAAMARTSDWLDWNPTEIGDATLSVDVSPHASEVIRDNNQSEAPISIRAEKLRVLVIESVPRWEYRYLRNALSRDPGVEVSCLLFHPQLDKSGGGNTDYIKDFPATKEELARYDVVFLGDVGAQEGQLTDEQCEWLKGLVEEQASGLVFMPGFYGHQFSLAQTALDELVPVIMDEGQPGGWGSRTAQHFELTELGRRSLLTKLADTVDDNLEVWNHLPGFQWHAPVLSAKPGTDTLAVHQEFSNEFGRLPLLVTRTYGAGKVLFMGTDGAWRWRKGVEDLYHYRFWGQVVRWMAYRRNMAQGENMRMYFSPERPKVGQTISITANVMESSGEPLSQGDVSLRVISPAKKLETIRFESNGGQWGAFSGRFAPTEPGEHELALFCKQTGDTLNMKLYVHGVALEQVGKPARPEVLEEIARITRGQVLSVDRMGDVIDMLSAMPDPPPAVRRVPVWSHPVVVAAFIGLLGLFWVGRKGAGLI